MNIVSPLREHTTLDADYATLRDLCVQIRSEDDISTTQLFIHLGPKRDLVDDPAAQHHHDEEAAQPEEEEALFAPDHGYPKKRQWTIDDNMAYLGYLSEYSYHNF
ncbi:hypothetical protein ACFE04_007950 [Oxalis oulophora]